MYVYVYVYVYIYIQLNDRSDASSFTHSHANLTKNNSNNPSLTPNNTIKKPPSRSFLALINTLTLTHLDSSAMSEGSEYVVLRSQEYLDILTR